MEQLTDKARIILLVMVEYGEYADSRRIQLEVCALSEETDSI